MVSHFFAQVITENFLLRMLPILQWGDEVTQQKSVLFISVKRKSSFMLVHQKIQLSSNSVEHNHISHQLKKGNHDLLHYLNWILFLTVMLWLSGIMIFVVSSNQQGKNRRFLVGLQNVLCVISGEKICISWGHYWFKMDLIWKCEHQNWMDMYCLYLPTYVQCMYFGVL